MDDIYFMNESFVLSLVRLSATIETDITIVAYVK